MYSVNEAFKEIINDQLLKSYDVKNSKYPKDALFIHEKQYKMLTLGSS